MAFPISSSEGRARALSTSNSSLRMFIGPLLRSPRRRDRDVAAAVVKLSIPRGTQITYRLVTI
jgi:hypothetical protein